MASEITEHDQNASPSVHDDPNGNNAGLVGDVSRGVKRQRPANDDEDDDEDKPGRERRKIEIKFIADKSRRHITFSKRKAGIMKKVRRRVLYALYSAVHARSRIVACAIAASHNKQTHRARRRSLANPRSTGLRAVRPHRHPGPVARRIRDWPRLHLHNTQAAAAGDQARGQKSHPGALLRCAASHPCSNLLQTCLNAPEPAADTNGVDGGEPVESPEDTHAQVPQGQPRGMPPAQMPPQYMTPEAALHYQNYMQQQQQQAAQYPGMPPQTGMPRHPGHQYPQDQKLS